MAGGGFVLDDNSSIGQNPNDNERMTKAVYQVALLAAIGGFLFGYDTGIVSGAMVYIKNDFKLSTEWQELIVSITILGAWMFSLVAAPLATIFGRKKVVYTASVIFTIGSVEMAVAWEKWSLLLGRFIVGAAIGLASMVTPMFIAEMAPARLRGSLVTTNNLFIAGGQAVAAVIAGVFGFLSGSIKWRLMLGIAAVPAVLQFIGFLFMPESPRWLQQQGREAEAKVVLQRLRGEDADINKEYDGIKRQCDSSKNQNTSFFSVLKKVMGDRHLRKALIVGCLLQTIQQLTGINTVMYYAATIIQMSGVHDPSTAVWMASATAVLNFLVNFIGVWLVEKIGRRLLTLSSLAGVTVSLALLAIGFHVLNATGPRISDLMATTPGTPVDSCMFNYQKCIECIECESCGFCFNSVNVSDFNACLSVEGKTKGESMRSMKGTMCEEGTSMNTGIVWAENWCPSPYSWLTLVGLMLYLFFFGPGLGPMPWTINSELFPLWARSVCYSITTAFNWFFNLLVSLTFLTLTETITKPGAFWLYTAFGVVGFVIFVIWLPETKGRSLESDIVMVGDMEAKVGVRVAKLPYSRLSTPYPATSKTSPRNSNNNNGHHEAD